MASTGSGGFIKQVEREEEEEEEKEEKRLLKELQALRHALQRAQHPASSNLQLPFNASKKKKQSQEEAFQRPPIEVRNSSALLQEIEIRSGWKWRPLRAFSHLGQQAFPCLFLAHVHNITNLPASMTGLRLNVHFSQRSSHAQTLPCRVSQGSAEIDEVVSIRCTVYGWSRKASQEMKYAPKCLILSVVAVDLNDLEVGRHQLDLTQMLPDKFSQGCGRKDVDQTTRFYLYGKANGGILMVSFGYEILLANKLGQGGIEDPHRSRSFSHSGVSEGDSWGFYSKTSRIGGVQALQIGDSAIQASKIVAVDSEDNVEFEVKDCGEEISTLNAAMILPPILENRQEEFETPKQLDVIVADKHPLPLLFPSLKTGDKKAKVVERGEQTRGSTLHDPSSEMSNVLSVNNPQILNVENSCHDNLHVKGFDVLQNFGGEKKTDLIDGKNADTVLVAQLKTEADAAALSLDNEEELIEGQFLQLLEEEHQFNQQSSHNKQNSPNVFQVKATGSDVLLNGPPSKLRPCSSAGLGLLAR